MRLEDIAKKAGVSRSTVSRALNNASDISDATREKIQKIVKELGYQPNPVAKMLASRRNHVIGIVVRSRVDVAFDTSLYLPTLLQGISDAVNERGYLSLIWLGTDSQHDADFQQKILSTSLVDGLIVVSTPRGDIFIENLLNIEIPFVMVEKPADHLDQVNYVAVDNVFGTEELINHLLKLGRNRIGIITGDRNNPDFAERLEVYKQTLKSKGITYKHPLIVERLDDIEQLIGNDVDAIFATNDSIAIQAIQYLQAHNITVPEQIAVVGFDDLAPAQNTIPALTTVGQSVHMKGLKATELLIDIIEGKVDGAQHIELPTRLVVRASCGSPVED